MKMTSIRRAGVQLAWLLAVSQTVDPVELFGQSCSLPGVNVTICNESRTYAMSKQGFYGCSTVTPVHHTQTEVDTAYGLYIGSIDHTYNYNLTLATINPLTLIETDVYSGTQSADDCSGSIPSGSTNAVWSTNCGADGYIAEDLEDFDEMETTNFCGPTQKGSTYAADYSDGHGDSFNGFEQVVYTVSDIYTDSELIGYLNKKLYAAIPNELVPREWRGISALE